MTLRRMIDAAYLPNTTANLQMVRNLTGASVAVVYVGGWGEPYHSTPLSQVQMLAGQGMLIIPILVPTPDSSGISVDAYKVGITKAVQLMQAAGLTGSLISCDYEAGWYSNNPAGVLQSQAAFKQACQEMGLSAVPYLSPSNATALASHPNPPDCVWVASWINTVPTSVASIPGLPDGLWNTPGQRAWQYQGGHIVAGDSIDSSLSELDGYWSPATPAPTPAPVVPAPLVPTTPQVATVPTSTLQEIEDDANAIVKMIQSVFD